MKVEYLFVVVALLTVSCDAAPATVASTLSPVPNSLLLDAHKCCVIACTDEQKESLQARADAYDGPDALAMRELVAKAVAGSCATARSKRAAGDSIVATCTSNPIDVANMIQKVQCTLNLAFAAGIYYVDSYAYNSNATNIITLDANYIYLDSYASAVRLTRVVQFDVPRYSMYGMWNINVTVYGSQFSSPLSNVTGYFTVLKTVNDIYPPVMTALNVPEVINLKDPNKRISIIAKDDASGISIIDVSALNGSNIQAYASWYGPYGPYYMSAHTIKPVTAEVSIELLPYNSAFIPGTYSLQVSVTDDLGRYVKYSAGQLAALGFPSTITFASSNCSAGSAPYNTTGVCTTCPVGTYAIAGAFRCTACPRGTYNLGTGASACSYCPAGTYGIGASWACSPCAPGTYQGATGWALCRPCDPGYNTTVTGATSCGRCPAGTYSVGGATTCKICPVGTFAQGSNAVYCSRCRPGTYSNMTSASSCSICPAGTYSGLGQTSCTACPAPKVMSTAGSNSQQNCY